MGGSFYDGDVSSRSYSASRSAFNFREPAVATPARVHADLDPLRRTLKIADSAGTPIVVAMDVTRSRGDDAKVVYNKLPMLVGQIGMKGYVEKPLISFAAIGDATVDRAPLQVGVFAGDSQLDDVLMKLWLEEGGGGTGQESYELAAYYYARHVDFGARPGDERGFFFFIGDEGFYPRVAKDAVQRLIGDELPADLPAADAFAELQRRFHVFFIYPQKSWQQRKSDIDAEIRQRVLAAGGLVDGVDIRASLIWNNRNDLDLHVITPANEHIYFGNKQATCGGWLDVDMNVSGETTKPVENVRWRRGEARKGRYRVFVRNYSFHEDSHAATPFRVELEVNGEVRHFEGEIKPGLTHEASDVQIAEFTYDPAGRKPEAAATLTARYEGYDDTKIKEQWLSVIPRENLLLIDDPKGIVDVLLGALSIRAGTRDLDSYLVDMQGRGQTELRCDQTRRALLGLDQSNALVKVEGAALAKPAPPATTRKSKGKRL